MMKEKNIQELAIRMGLISVEDMCQYTIAQLVVKIANKVNELVNEVWRFESDVQEILKTQNENIQYLLGEGLHLEVENIFDGWVQDGTFDTLLNQSALKKVNDRIDETNAQLSVNATKINEIFSGNTENREPYRLAREPKSTFNKATVISINNTNRESEVMGIREDSQLATYADRDGVIMYSEYTLPKRTMVNAVEFGLLHVKTSDDLTHINIEVGDVIDVMKTGTFETGFYQVEKYSGIISSFDKDKQMIYVGGWYQQGNTSVGQIPSISDGYVNVIINPITKGWVQNANIFLDENSHAWGGVIGEYGLFNSKSKLDTHNRLAGHDTCNFCGHAEYGYLVRGSNFDPENPPITDVGYWAKDDTIKKGFLAQDNIIGHEAKGCTHGFVASAVTESAFRTENNKFFILPDGTHQAFAIAYKVQNNPLEGINAVNAPLHIFVENGTYNLQQPSDTQFLVIKLYSLQEDNQVLVNGKFSTKYGSTNQIQLKKQSSYELFSDGNVWYVMDL